MENKILMNILCNDANCKQRQEYLNKRKSLKNQIIFHHYNMEEKSFQTEETRTESEDKHNQSDDKSLILSDLELENESLSSIDFDAIKLTSDQFVDETGENQLNEEQHPDNEQEIQSSGMIFDKMMVSGEKGK
uniref:Uncharacterized protein n=1 Tax=Megaselia scalaris TaxID=36166 RepID=T1GXD8_MEGSC